MGSFMDNFNDAAEEASFDSADVQQYKIQAVLPYLIPILFFLPIVSNKESNFCRFHANQQLIWLVTCVIINIVLRIINFIPVLGMLVYVLASLAVLVFAILLMVSASQGKAVKIPFVGDLFRVF